MITLAKKEDLERIYELICILEDKQINKDHFQTVFYNSFNQQDIHFLVYKIQDKIVGFMSFYIHHYLHHHQDTGEIVELIVDPQYRSQNIGKQFLDYAINLAREYDLEQIELSTSTYRKKAHRFYEDNGYSKDHYNYTLDIKS